MTGEENFSETLPETGMGFSGQTMSSREIAVLTSKQHKNVLADCDSLNENYSKMGMAEISAMNYKADNGQVYREYQLTRIQTFDLMTGYNIELRIKVNRRWEELEKKQATLDFSNPQTILQLAQNWAEEQQKRLAAEQRAQMLDGENQSLNHEVKTLAPKAQYFDEVLQSTTTYTMTQVAKELGMSATALERFLHQKGVIFRQSTSWLPYSKYQDAGYHKFRTHRYIKADGTNGSNTILVWTEKGKHFIHELHSASEKKEMTANR
jgi:phage antirepressor YoqD-like protein